MSWQAYVDNNLLGTGKVAKAAILGLAGGVWAKSPGFDITPEEQKAIIAGFSAPDTIQASGVRLAGQKFYTLFVIDRTIQAKKAADGVVIVKTKQAVLVAEYVGPVQAPEVTPIVEGLADYLISVGY
ncbi:Profilin-1A [Psilocybe cubensis]|uniref:Profilin n=2 Tax=Psilocybe cubensis TaxID=181762 RepID=A0A8H8CJ28_PSICU|nr:Profilin-1A [Psilocybe cubensis]KAH9476062.1 Profilin-1A [Psilocybe cubensis]